MTHTLRSLALVFFGLMWGCSANDGVGYAAATPGTGKLGDECQKSEDCESTFCVDSGGGNGRCSQRCGTSGDCPDIDNWACVNSGVSGLNLCACRLTETSEVCGDGLDNDCDGVADDCRICGGEVVANDDPLNCGKCDNACRADQSCKKGACSCPANLPDNCGVCTSTRADGRHCGTCGTVCGEGQACVEGKCVCPEGTADTFCQTGGCVDVTTNADNCGACGTSCTLGSTCTDGKCVCPTEGQKFCDAVGCVDPKTSPTNCGACGNACSADKVCLDGKCGCAEGKALCGDSCVDLQTDAAHCGACETACGTAQACVGGKCGCENLGLTVCGSACANVQTDAKHCGGCDKACKAGERCSAGSCVCDSNLYCSETCAASTDVANCGVCGNQCGTGQTCSALSCVCQGTGLSACGTSCVALQTDEANCGTCGSACLTGQTCLSGKCGCNYTTQTYCATSQSCVYLTSDAANCGTCGNACKAGQTCSTGTCRCTTTGLTYCDQAAACTNLLTDANNCGTCGTVCRSGETCTSGMCKCPTGQTYCEVAGKCVTLSTDSANCGTCGNACPATQTCLASVCKCPLSTQKYCDTACIDVYADATNCGACGNVCPADTSCKSATCACTDTTKTLCSNACYDLKTDKNHCGTCATACSGNLVCTAGQCVCPVPVVGTAVRLTSNALHDAKPSAAWNGTHVGVAYIQALTATGATFDVRFARLNSDGTIASDAAITDYTSNTSASCTMVSSPKVVWNGKEFAVLWVQNAATTGVRQLMFLRLDAEGNPNGAPVMVGDGTVVSASTYSSLVANLAWSETGQTFAVVFGEGSRFAFRLIGKDGLTLGTPFIANESWSSSESHPLQLGVAPAGTWAVASGNSYDVNFSLFNADGSRTSPLAKLATTADYSYSRWPSMVFDGTTWATAWIAYTPAYDIYVNRGTVANTPQRLIPTVSPAMFGGVNLAMTGSALAVGFSERTSSTSTAYRYRVQRFGLPATLTTALPALHAAVDVVPTYTITDPGDVALTSAGSGRVLAVWSDNRWGSVRELYAAPVDLQSCP